LNITHFVHFRKQQFQKDKAIEFSKQKVIGKGCLAMYNLAGNVRTGSGGAFKQIPDKPEGAPTHMAPT